jgi:hypothetical protein
MDKEIEKLKKIYLETEAPLELLQGGFEDVMRKIEGSKKPFYFSRVFISAVFVIVLISGFSGLTFASKPNTILYPVKVTTQNVISSISHTNPQEVKQTVQQFIELKKATPTPTSAIPTPTKGVLENNTLSNDISEENEKSSSQNKIDQKNGQEIKGVSVTIQNENEIQNEEDNKASNNSQNNEHNNSQNGTGGKSDNSSRSNGHSTGNKKD